MMGEKHVEVLALGLKAMEFVKALMKSAVRKQVPLG